MEPAIVAWGVWSQILPHLPIIHGAHPVGLHPTWRFAKSVDTKQHPFATITHKKLPFCYPSFPPCTSLLTLQLYLNDDYSRGEICLWDDDNSKWIHVEPRTGDILVFNHEALYKTEPIELGEKYIARTNILFLPPDALVPILVQDNIPAQPALSSC
jgi:hypothetical protein